MVFQRKMALNLDINSEWIKSVRTERNAVEPSRPYAFSWDRERAQSGDVVDVATVFLTNRECPWKCLMCDLWKNTTEAPVDEGAIPTQIEFALNELGRRSSLNQQIKLYNSGSFFDAKAIPVADHPRIAQQVQAFERVIVECHPALINDRVLAFRDLLGDVKLEIAMGLETVDPNVLPKLNKGVTIESFQTAASFLRGNQIDLRIFVLVKTPWQTESDAVDWAVQSFKFSVECGATVAALIPTRFGNGALEKLAERGDFEPPQLSTLEQAFEQSLKHVAEPDSTTRIFADLWDLGQFSNCAVCFEERRARLERMNFEQRVVDTVRCEACGNE